MNYHDIEKTIDELKKPTVSTPGYKWALKRELLSKHKPVKRSFSVAEFITMNINKLLIGGVGVAFVFAFVFLAPQMNSPEALAAELIEKAQTRTLALSPEERAAIEARIQGDMLVVLAEAKEAMDLQVLDEAGFREFYGPESNSSIALRNTEPTHGVTTMEIQAFGAADETQVIEAMPLSEEDLATAVTEYKTLPNTTGTDVSVPGGTFALESAPADTVSIQFKPPVQYLRYTDEEGRQVTLGLDEDNTPIIMFIDVVFDEQ